MCVCVCVMCTVTSLVQRQRHTFKSFVTIGTLMMYLCFEPTHQGNEFNSRVHSHRVI